MVSLRTVPMSRFREETVNKMKQITYAKKTTPNLDFRISKITDAIKK